MAHTKTSLMCSTKPIEPTKAEKAKDEKKPPVELMAYTIRGFCAAHHISIDTYFRMQRTGTGPAIKKIGKATRITVEAAKAWREAGEAATKKAETKGEAASAKA
jgi:hypothetical protein